MCDYFRKARSSSKLPPPMPERENSESARTTPAREESSSSTLARTFRRPRRVCKPGLFWGILSPDWKKSDAERHKNSAERRRLKATLRMGGEPSSRRNLLVFFFLVAFVERPRPTTALTSAHRENAFIGYSEKKQIRLCVDSIQMCSDWAKNGECAKNPGYMSENCCCGATLFFWSSSSLFGSSVRFFIGLVRALGEECFSLSLFLSLLLWTRARRLTDDDTVTIFKLSLAKQRATRSVPRRPTTRRRKK